MEKANRVAKAGFSFDSGCLAQARLARRQVGKDVALWPVVLPEGAHGGELWPLADALEDGFVGFGPDSRPGRVRVESRAPVPIWVPAGESLGAWGWAERSACLPPHGSGWVRARGVEGGCSRCSRTFAEGFCAVEGQVGFVLALHDRSIAIELVLPGAPFARRLRLRLEAWAPWLLESEASGRATDGYGSPEDLLAAALAAEPLVAGARAEIVAPWARPQVDSTE